jgi:hypothetical protein
LHFIITSSLHAKHELTCFGEISMQQAALAAKSEKSKKKFAQIQFDVPIH